MSEDKFDGIPDNFASVEDVDWSHTLNTPPMQCQHPLSMLVSSDYGDDKVTEEFLAELDVAEKRAWEEMQASLVRGPVNSGAGGSSDGKDTVESSVLDT